MSAPVTQLEALGAVPLAAGESARFFTSDRFAGLDFLAATFVTHAYAPHTHETYVVGSIDVGCEMWNARGTLHYGGPGDVLFNHPLDVHDGFPHGGGYSYRMAYPSIPLMSRIAAEVSGGAARGAPFFPAPVVRDPEGAAQFSAAHTLIADGHDRLGGEELLERVLARFIVRHARISAAAFGCEPSAVRRVRDLIEAHYAEDLSLEALARTARLSRHHLIRVFRRDVGLTPHAYVIDVRVRRAQERLKSGEAPASVAGAVGFADQAHMTRAFKARLAVTPGAYRRAVGA